MIIAVLLVAVAVVALVAAFVPSAAHLEPAARWGMKGAQVAVILYVLYDVIA